MKCKGCGNTLEKFEFQSRSADEAHSLSYRCTKCPLNIDKFNSSIQVPHLYLKRIQRTYTPTSYTSLNSTLQYTIISSRTYNKSLYSDLEKVECKVFNVLDKDSRLYKVHCNGPWNGMGICKFSSRKLSFNSELTTVNVLYNIPHQAKQYTDFEYACVEDYIVIYYNDYIEICCMVQEYSEELVIQHLNNMYLLGFHPRYLTEYVDKIKLGSMSNLSARAYDSNTVDESHYQFSTKPDGERMWIVKSGTVWLYCRRLKGFSIVSFEFEDSISFIDNNKFGPVIDCEIMLNHPPILIDVLIDSKYCIAPVDRNLQWISDNFDSIVQDSSFAKYIHRRKFFESFYQAKEYSKLVSYSTDGIVAISSTGTDMKKIKEVKSMELEIGNNGILLSKNGKSLMKLSNPLEYEIGSIVEIRFSVHNAKINVHEHFHRPDKTIANDDTAIESILQSCISSKSSSATRVQLWRWSNKLRYALYRVMQNTNTNSNIVLDVGSGSGQSSEAFTQLPNCSFILVEPDNAKCKALAQRLDVNRVHRDPRSIINVISQLKKGSRKFHIVNTTLQSILSDKSVTANLKGTVKCSVACFSAHYITDCIQGLMELKIPFIGCYYSYNELAISESIINTDSIKMTKISDTEASVKWGSDTRYIEPVVDENNFPMACNLTYATDLVMAPSQDTNNVLYKAAKAVKILICR